MSKAGVPKLAPRTILKDTGPLGPPPIAAVPLGPLIDPIDDELDPLVPLFDQFAEECIDPYDDEYETAGLAEFFGPICNGLG